MSRTLRLILGDQLNYEHSWFDEDVEDIDYVLMEIRSETDYVKHHIQKLVAFFASMREFANYLSNKLNKSKVHYIKINDKDNFQSFSKNLNTLIESNNYTKFEYQLPDEYRLDKELTEFSNSLSIKTEAFDSEHFYTTRYELKDFFEGKKQYVLESFYRHMREKHDVMMEQGKPIGGKWNFDASNRKPINEDTSLRKPLALNNNLSEIYEEITVSGAEFFGNINPNKINFPINREQSLELLEYFCSELLIHFGDYQDAMLEKSWSLFHSRLSFALNVKMLSPKEVNDRVIEEWEKRSDEISLNQVEGFVRQILGWREYMRGVYWAKMPEYADLNFFGHENKLPVYFWNGETKMNCIKNAVQNSLDNAYAHHIQRLMITGNFALLAGVNPNEVDAWYLGIYADAIEWVEITNTRGMSQYADGGIVGTKPYVSTANYINKMSDYCKSCSYSHSKKVGNNSCPFNSLYWHFYERNRDKLEKNPRIGFVYPTLNKMKAENKAKIMQRANFLLNNLENL